MSQQPLSAPYGVQRTPWRGISNGSGWMWAHISADQRAEISKTCLQVARRHCPLTALPPTHRGALALLPVSEMEENFVRIVNWWTALDPLHHFASPKQGTLLTAMVRGGLT